MNQQASRGTQLDIMHSNQSPILEAPRTRSHNQNSGSGVPQETSDEGLSANGSQLRLHPRRDSRMTARMNSAMHPTNFKHSQTSENAVNLSYEQMVRAVDQNMIEIKDNNRNQNQGYIIGSEQHAMFQEQDVPALDVIKSERLYENQNKRGKFQNPKMTSSQIRRKLSRGNSEVVSPTSK